MTTSEPTRTAEERLRALAQQLQRADHWEWVNGSQNGEFAGNNGHVGDSDTCPHPDCLLVRSAHGAKEPEPFLFKTHLEGEVNAAHRLLDKLGAPKTKRVLNRNYTGEQDITLGIADRSARLLAGLAKEETPAGSAQAPETAEDRCSARTSVFGRCTLRANHDGRHVNALNEQFAASSDDHA